MTVRKLLVVAVAVLALVAAGLVRPRPAAAGVDPTLPLIISGAVAGTVALITIIAIIASKKSDDPDLPLMAGRRIENPDRSPRRAGWVTQCRPEGPGLTLLCW
jgi:hypothetical protein